MLDVLLIQPNSRASAYGPLARFAAVEPPVWAGLLATFLLKKGYGVEILDAHALDLPAGQIGQRVADAKPRLAVAVAYGHQPSASTQTMPAAREALQAIRQHAPWVPTAILGGHPSALPERTLREEPVDFVVEGEGPYTLAALLDALKAGSSVEKVPGLWWKDAEGRRFQNAPAPLVKDLDGEMPRVAWEKLPPLTTYRTHNWHALGHADPSPFAALYTTLNCPYKCLTGDTQVVTMLGNKRLSEIRPHESILGWDQDRAVWNEVHMVLCRGADEIYEVQCEDGTALRGTAEHPLWTRRGWVNIGELQRGDEIWSVVKDHGGAETLLGEMAGSPSPLLSTLSEADHQKTTNGRILFPSVRRARKVGAVEEAPNQIVHLLRQADAVQKRSCQDPMLFEALSLGFAVSRYLPPGPVAADALEQSYESAGDSPEGVYSHPSPTGCLRCTSQKTLANRPVERPSAESNRPYASVCTDDPAESHERSPSRATGGHQDEGVVCGSSQQAQVAARSVKASESLRIGRPAVDHSGRTAVPICGGLQLLGRPRTVWETAKSGFCSHGAQDGAPRPWAILAPTADADGRGAQRLRQAGVEVVYHLGHGSAQYGARRPNPNVDGRWIRIATVLACGRATVYDIEAHGSFNFFANGILVKNCSFCCISSPFGGPGYQKWSPALIGHEIQRLIESQGGTTLHVKIVDEMFWLDERHVEALCDELDQERGLGLYLNIWAYARVDSIRRPALLDKARRAGFRWLALGIEAADSAVRDGQDKDFSDAQIVKTVRAIQDAGIHVIANYMFGLEGDTLESMQRTLDLALELRTEWANFYGCMIYPGSRLYADAVRDGKPLSGNWASYAPLGYECIPFAPDGLTPAEVLRFRDMAFLRYFGDPEYLAMILEKFGQPAVADIQAMLAVPIKRKILETRS